MLKLLIWFHVMSAIIGIGPTFIFGLFFQKNQSIAELKQSIGLTEKALYFNKIGAPLAALSGIALVLTGKYGTWMQLWILGALLLFVIITVISIPLGKNMSELKKWLNSNENKELDTLPEQQENEVKKANNVINIIHILTILLFTLMILKPIVF